MQIRLMNFEKGFVRIVSRISYFRLPECVGNYF